MSKAEAFGMEHPKLARLARDEGFTDVLDFIQFVHTDSVVPGICMNEGCSYSTRVEPDSSTGWCEECDENSVASCLILAGII